MNGEWRNQETPRRGELASREHTVAHCDDWFVAIFIPERLTLRLFDFDWFVSKGSIDAFGGIKPGGIRSGEMRAIQAVRCPRVWRKNEDKYELQPNQFD